MRSLIEECGHTIIALIIASSALIFAIFGFTVPSIQAFVEDSVPEDVVSLESDFASNFNRANPVITISTPITINSGAVQINFNDYISNGAIKASNADGVDISSNIIIKAANSDSARFYNESEKIFRGANIAAGDYNFIVSVIDYTNEKYYGKVSETNFIVSVTNP